VDAIYLGCDVDGFFCLMVAASAAVEKELIWITPTFSFLAVLSTMPLTCFPQLGLWSSALLPLSI
jgi:hypothetical protein